MAIEIVDLPSYKMVIFNSYVSLPEGNVHLSPKNIPYFCSMGSVPAWSARKVRAWRPGDARPSIQDEFRVWNVPTLLLGWWLSYIIYIYIYHIPVVPARGGAEVALKIYIYNTFLIYRTCTRRAPAKPVRACTLRNWCRVSHVTFEAPLHTSQLTVCTLHTTHFTLRSLHFTLHTLHTPHSSHFTLHPSQSTLHTCFHTPHFTLHTSHSTLHTALFTPHTSHCTLHTPHFISSELFSALLHVSKVEGNSCWCIASNRNGKCEHGVVVTCQGDSRSPSSTAAFFSALHLVV